MWLLGRQIDSTDATMQVKTVDGRWLDWVNIKDEYDIKSAEVLIDDPQYRIIVRNVYDRTLWDIYSGGSWDHGRSLGEAATLLTFDGAADYLELANANRLEEKTFVIHWSGSISWQGNTAEGAIEDFKNSKDFGHFMKNFSVFEESKW